MTDRHGIISLPIKLTVSILVIGLAVPIVLAMADNVMEQDTVMELEDCGRQLKDALTRTYYSGVGNSQSVQISVPAGGTLCVGGEGSERYAIRLLNDGEQVGRVYLDNPVFSVYGDVTALSGHCYLTLTSYIEDTGDDRRLCVKVDLDA